MGSLDYDLSDRVRLFLHFTNKPPCFLSPNDPKFTLKSPWLRSFHVGVNNVKLRSRLHPIGSDFPDELERVLIQSLAQSPSSLASECIHHIADETAERVVLYELLVDLRVFLE